MALKSHVCYVVALLGYSQESITSKSAEDKTGDTDLFQED